MRIRRYILIGIIFLLSNNARANRLNDSDLTYQIGYDSIKHYLESRKISKKDFNLRKIKVLSDGFVTDGKTTQMGVIRRQGLNKEELNQLYLDYLASYRAAPFVRFEVMEQAVDPETFKIISLKDHISLDKDHVYASHKIIHGADPKTFRYLDRYAVDSKRAYYIQNITQYKTMEGIDANSFEVIPDNFVSYAKDKSQVYYRGQIIEGADPKTFEIIKQNNISTLGLYIYSYAKDHNSVFRDGVKIEKADRNTFRLLDNFYGIDKTHVFYGAQVIRNADPNSFNIIGNRWGKDKVAIYVEHQRISNPFDVESFEILYQPVEYFDVYYIKDKNGIYLMPFRMSRLSKSERRDEVELNEIWTIENADLETFEFLQNNYAKDKNHLFYGGVPLKIKSDSYKLLGDYIEDKNQYHYYIALDDHNVYYGSHQLKGADPASFINLKGGYSKDKAQVYYQYNLVVNADAASFVYHSHYYAQDKQYLYVKGKRVKNSHSATFKQFDDWYGKDKNNAYFQGEAIDQADSKTFQYLDEGYAIDQTHLFFHGEIVENADVASFKIKTDAVREHRDEDGRLRVREIVGQYGYDKNHCYEAGVITKCLPSWNKDWD